MQLLDRYLKNLAKLLPTGQREDIIRELSEDIQSEMEDKESELSRPLTEAEQLELLKRRGTPLQVAAGYSQNKGTLAFGPQLIGPVLFPFYARVLLFNLGLTFVIVGAIFAAIALSGQPIRLSELFSNILLQIAVQLAAVTTIFTLVERHLDSHSYSYKREEVQVEFVARIKQDILVRSTKPQEVSRFDSIAILVASSVALLWLQSLWAKPFLIFGPAASLIAFAPVWHRIYLSTVFIMLATIVRACINLAQPNWVHFRDVAAVVLDAAALAVIYVLMFAHTWVVPIDTSASAQHIATVVNQWTTIGIWASAVICLVQAIKDLIRLYKNWRWSRSNPL